ncbi:urea transporter [Corynebacterium lipophiloflavum]|uniref:Urea transporter n=1 Tax=Corynebacterium lipophiloflavum (strain ATCC 700352 / DSM 44291 / CCUG 37336 / JCM 10383 / DMMZ 1944) TaxID=525263 RepID=C0XS70_CORLD|nr:urea transporter [Corynebacterium lipophiloflavum]EEI16891.1 urea transporter [Corynebacterium lipophiloflavum DSM 44291]
MSAMSMRTPAGAVAPLLRGVSQIFFIADWRTGLLITAGVAVYNPLAAIFMLLGAAAQELGAWAMGQDRHVRREGIAGFNGALVGVVSWLLAPTIASGALLAVCGGFATVIVFELVERAFNTPALARIGLPVSTAPFCLLASAMFFLIPAQSAGPGPTSDGGVFEGFGLGVLNGFAEVVLADGPLTGALILAGVALGAPAVAGFGLLGAFIATAAADLVVGVEPASTGLMTYSGVLTAMALGAVVPVSSPLKSRVAWAAAGVLVSVALTLALRGGYVPTFTWPFLLSMWVVLAAAAAVRYWRQEGSCTR